MLWFDTEAAQDAGGAIDVRAELRVGDRAPRVPESHAATASLGEVAVHEEAGGIEAGREIHGRYLSTPQGLSIHSLARDGWADRPGGLRRALTVTLPPAQYRVAGPGIVNPVSGQKRKRPNVAEGTRL